MCYSWHLAFSVLSAGSLVFATLLQSHWGDMRMKHAWDEVPPNWEHFGHPPAETLIDLYIALKPERENALIDALHEVSDPSHPKYGEHLSREQVAGLVAPHPDTLELVNSWFEHHGVPSSSVSTSHGGGWLTVTGVPVSRANALLGTSYRLYQHAETKDRVLRTLDYALPAVLHAHVQTVAPTTYFDLPRRTLRQTTPQKRSGEEAAGELARALSSRDNSVAPTYLRWRYNTQEYVPLATEQNVLGVVGYFGEYPSEGDLAIFMRRYRTDGVDATFTLRQAGRGNLPERPSEESNLEIQYTEAITYPTPHIYYTTISELRFLLWLDAMLGGEDVPQTISTSYSDNEKDFPRDYASAVCTLFAQLGARGASVITSSGDDGIGSGDCVTWENGVRRIHYVAKFPASCPWLTSVGATIIAVGGTPVRNTNFEGGDEVAAFYSSGGFSNYFLRPPYQGTAVPSYLATIRDRPVYYNRAGRGFPDLSSQAELFRYIIRGRTDWHWGTGCSAPTVAAVISLLNDYLISRNMPPLGWINPWLYRDGQEGFNDITLGTNLGCGGNGFPARPGWDPATGFGSPNFQNLLTILDRTARDGN